MTVGEEIISDADVQDFVEFFNRYTQFWKRKTFLQLVELARTQKFQLDQIALEDAAIRSSQNHGPARDMWITDVGQIMKGGKLTELGEQWTYMNTPVMLTRGQVLQAFAKALKVSDATGWSTGKLILQELFVEQEEAFDGDR